MDQSLKRQIAEQASDVQIAIGEIEAVAHSIVRAIDDNRELEAEQLGRVIIVLSQRAVGLAEQIELNARATYAEAEGNHV